MLAASLRVHAGKDLTSSVCANLGPDKAQTHDQPGHNLPNQGHAVQPPTFAS